MVAVGGLILMLCLFTLLQLSWYGMVQSISSPGAISSFSPGAQYIMLTFNNAELEPARLKRILSILTEHKARATFFLSGNKHQISNSGELLKQIHDSLSEVALMGPPRLTSTTQDKIVSHFQQIGESVKDVIKTPVKFVRPQGGQTNAQINNLLKHNNSMQMVLWSIDAEDYKVNSIDGLANFVTQGCKPGDIVMFHCVNDLVVDALPSILKDLLKQGYEMITLAQVASYPDDSPH